MKITLVVAALIGLIPAKIASNRGRNFLTWGLYGALLFIIALPHSLLLKEENAPGKKKCPYCKEVIDEESTVCPHCRSKLTQEGNNWGR